MYDQDAVIEKLNKYLQIKKRTMILTSGYCHGLTLYWLYKMSQNKEQWFYDTVKKIVDTPEEKIGDIEIDIEKFLAHIEWLQQPEKYIPSIWQMDMDKSMEIPKALPVSSIFSSRQLQSILRLVIQPNKMICISGPDHSIGVFRRENVFYVFNANYQEGEAKKIQHIKISQALKMLKYEIIQCLFSDFNHPTKKLAITMNVVGHPYEYKRRTRALKMLINADGYIMRFCDLGLGPLFLACENNDEEFVRMLLRKGAPPNKATNDGALPLLLCSYSGYNHLVKLLLRYGANPNLEGREGLPLYSAVKNGHTQVVYTLLQNDAKINKPDRDGDTAIFAAVNQNRKELLTILLEHGADPLHARKNGDTPMDIAIQNKHWELVALMLLHVASPHTRNIEALKTNKNFIATAVQSLIKTRELAPYQGKQIRRILNKITYHSDHDTHSTKLAEFTRRLPMTDDNNRFFTHRKALPLSSAYASSNRISLVGATGWSPSLAK